MDVVEDDEEEDELEEDDVDVNSDVVEVVVIGPTVKFTKSCCPPKLSSTI